MEHAFQIGYRKGDKVFYVPPTNWYMEEAFVVDHIHEWEGYECITWRGVERRWKSIEVQWENDLCLWRQP